MYRQFHHGSVSIFRVLSYPENHRINPTVKTDKGIVTSDEYNELRSLILERDTVMRELMNERDRRYDERFEAQQRAVTAAFIASEKSVVAALQAAERAVLKAEAAADKRFESVNEFRAQLTDQAATFMPRSEADIRLSAITQSIDRMLAQLAGLAGRSSGLNAGWGYLIGAVALIAAVVGLVVR